MSKDGKLVLVENPSLKPYIVYDDHTNSPTGFGVRIGATKKTYIIQRRVRSGHKNKDDVSTDKVKDQVIRAKVGNVSDFASIDHARAKAQELLLVMTKAKRNPSKVAREQEKVAMALEAAEVTLREAFAIHRRDLLARPVVATVNTLAAFDKAFKRLGEWGDRRISSLTGDEVVAKFDALAAKTRTAAEQTFRWADVAAKTAIAKEAMDAAAQKRVPVLTYNPFTALRTKGRYRTRAQLENAYKKKGIRNPLTEETLGKWFEVLFTRRPDNRTGCDYLILTTLWGTRREEALRLVWGDMISQDEALTCSHIDLTKRRVFFYDTKNRENHELPIADAAYEILNQRHEISLAEKNAKRRKWVFPARARTSKIGHYTDMRTLLGFVCEDAGIRKLTMHDLRRTFGRFADLHTSYATVKRLLNHGQHSDPTSRYTEADEKRLAEVMQRLEVLMLSTCPKLYNSLYAGKRELLATTDHSFQRAEMSLEVRA